MKLMHAFVITSLLTTPLLADPIDLPAPAASMSLGVKVYQNWRGLRVIGTTPGFAADGLLEKNDIIVGVATEKGVYFTQSLAQLEWAKKQIGPNESAAVRVLRPGCGEVHFLVTLKTATGGKPTAIAAIHKNALPQPKMRTALRRSEDAKKFFEMHDGKSTGPKLPPID